MLALVCLSLTCFVGDLIDRLARPSRAFLGGGPAAVAFRFTALCWLLVVATAIARRPLFGSAATAVTVAILVIISNRKLTFLREPLVFSDLSFIGEVFRRPEMFYLSSRTLGLIACAAAATLGVIAVWWRVEPPSVSAGGHAALIAAAGLLPLLALLPGTGGILGRWAGDLAAAPRRDGHLATLGLLASLVVYWIGWLRDGRAQGSARPDPAAARLGDGSDYEAIIVIQAESFVDLRRYGRGDLRLAGYDALKSRALMAGLLEVPCFGAYTLRTEAALITGRGFAQAGFDAFHPYLRPARLAPDALPNRLSRSWRTVFLHPYHKAFFRRDRAMPQLGFERFIDQSDFHAADRDGPYVGDVAVARSMLDALAEARRSESRIYLQVVTMEAHDPFGPGRLAHAAEPTPQFIHHLGNADRMLAMITTELDRSADRVLLVHYGDHAPLLADFDDPFTDTRTDFLVVELGRNARSGPIPHAVTRPEHLHRFVVDRLGTRETVS